MEWISSVAPGAVTQVYLGLYFVTKSDYLIPVDPMLAVLLAVQYAASSRRSVPSHCANVLWYCCAGGSWSQVFAIATQRPRVQLRWARTGCNEHKCILGDVAGGFGCNGHQRARKLGRYGGVLADNTGGGDLQQHGSAVSR